MGVDRLHFRHIAGHFATGVTVITTGRDGVYHGMTANAFTSLSLEPALALVCVEKSAHTYPVLDQSGLFNVNVLGENQQHLSRLFANKESQAGHDLNGIAFSLGATGAPLLAGCLAYIECRVVARHDGGDHTIFVGVVERAALGENNGPLLFYRGAYRKILE